MKSWIGTLIKQNSHNSGRAQFTLNKNGNEWPGSKKEKSFDIEKNNNKKNKDRHMVLFTVKERSVF